MMLPLLRSSNELLYSRVGNNLYGAVGLAVPMVIAQLREHVDVPSVSQS